MHRSSKSARFKTWLKKEIKLRNQPNNIITEAKYEYATDGDYVISSATIESYDRSNQQLLCKKYKEWVNKARISEDIPFVDQRALTFVDKYSNSNWELFKISNAVEFKINS